MYGNKLYFLCFYTTDSDYDRIIIENQDDFEFLETFNIQKIFMMRRTGDSVDGIDFPEWSAAISNELPPDSTSQYK